LNFIPTASACCSAVCRAIAVCGASGFDGPLDVVPAAVGLDVDLVFMQFSGFLFGMSERGMR
jgi:hypothetical protein